MSWSGDPAYQHSEGWIYLCWPHRRLDGGRRREPDSGTNRANSITIQGCQSRRGVCRPDLKARKIRRYGVGLEQVTPSTLTLFEAFLDASLTPSTARPRYTIAADLPSTATHVLAPVDEGTAVGKATPLWVRELRGSAIAPRVRPAKADMKYGKVRSDYSAGVLDARNSGERQPVLVLRAVTEIRQHDGTSKA